MGMGEHQTTRGPLTRVPFGVHMVDPCPNGETSHDHRRHSFVEHCLRESEFVSQTVPASA